MTKKLLIPLVLLMLLSACGTVLQPTPGADLQATNADLSIKATVMAAEKNALSQALTQVALQPSPTCPACPTPEPSLTPSPVPPTATPENQATPTATAGPTGSISGTLIFPSDHIPRQRVLAYNFNTGHYYWMNTNAGQNYYRLDDIPVGRYWVLAYLVENPSNSVYAAYSKAAICMMQNAQAQCDDHSLVEVEVKAGEETKDISPWDWYNPDPAGSGWPTDPTLK